MQIKMKLPIKMEMKMLMAALHYASWLARANSDDLEGDDADEYEDKDEGEDGGCVKGFWWMPGEFVGEFNCWLMIGKMLGLK